MSDYDISAAFGEIENELIDSMMRNFSRHRAEETAEGFKWAQWQAMQLESLEKYRKENIKKYSGRFDELNSKLAEMLKAAFADGSAAQEAAIISAIKSGFKYALKSGSKSSSAGFFRLNERKLNALIKATTDDLKTAETAVLRLSNDKYRAAIFNAQVAANTGALTYEKAVDMAVRDMLRAGLNCVEYKNGARHTLEDYAEMAIRTANKRAYLMGEGEKRKEFGITTVVVNNRQGGCPKCARYIGRVFIDDVYSGGKQSDGDYPLLSEAIKGGLFHPRCKDSTSTYFEGITTLKPVSEEEMKEMDRREKPEQKQSCCKNEAKKNRRIAKHSLDPDNKRIYAKRAEAFEEKAEKLGKTLENSGESGIIKVEANDENNMSKYLYNGLSREERKEIITKGQGVDKPVFSYDTKNNKAMSYLRKVPPREGMYDICAHGSPSSIEFFKQDYPSGDKRASIDAYTLSCIIRGREDYQAFLIDCKKKGLTPNIRLFSCSTGREVSGNKCFAKLLAEELGITVYAPSKKLYVYSNGNYYVGKKRDGIIKAFNP